MCGFFVCLFAVLGIEPREGLVHARQTSITELVLALTHTLLSVVFLLTSPFSDLQFL